MADTSDPKAILAESTNAAVERVSSAASSAATVTREAASASVESVKDFSAKYGITVFFSILIAAAILFTAYFLYNYISGILANKITWIIPETKVPTLGNVYTKASGDGIPTNLNGRRMTFMFWIYINDITSGAGEYRHVLHRGEENPAISASPLVMLDKQVNKLYIRFSTKTIVSDTTRDKTWADIITNSKKSIAPGCAAAVCTTAEQTAIDAVTDEHAIIKDLSTHGIIVDYVPLQRWVHIAVVVDDTVNKGSINLYMDGELVKSVSSSESVVVSGSTYNYSFQDLNLEKKGDIWRGGSSASIIGNGFSGLTGKIGFTNFEMNAKDVYQEYLKGPMDNLTSKLGLPAYGVRSPVYRLG